MDSRCEQNCLKASTRCATAEKAECEPTAPNDMMQEIWTCEMHNPRRKHLCSEFDPDSIQLKSHWFNTWIFLEGQWTAKNVCNRSADGLKANESTSGWVIWNHTPRALTTFPKRCRSHLPLQLLEWGNSCCDEGWDSAATSANLHGLLPDVMGQKLGLKDIRLLQDDTRWYNDVVAGCNWWYDIPFIPMIYLILCTFLWNRQSHAHFTSIHLSSGRCTVPVAILTG